MTNTTHGHTRGGKQTPTYSVWVGMLQRCHNPKNPSWPRYGGRGIRVCDRWRTSYENFLADMGERPEGMSVDRLDHDGNYEPGNCRWGPPLRVGKRGLPIGPQESDALQQIRDKCAVRDAEYEQANRELVAFILELREAGATWPVLAEAMEMTRQGLDKFLARNREA